MAAVGAEVTGSWVVSSGVFSFFILLLLLSIFLTALCADCRRHSFELREPEDRNPSSLVRVVKLEEVMGARENPAINEIQNDEKGNAVVFTPWRSHLEAPQNHQDVQTNGSAAVKTKSEYETVGGSNPVKENPVPFTPWRSHLGVPQSHDLNGSTPRASDHIYHDIGGGRTNDEPGEERSARSAAADLSERERNSMYARVSKKDRLTTPPVQTPEEVQVKEEEEEEPSPPLPDRMTQLEG
ncbi:uncharacterized protein si:ch73-204p21.2 [Dicentrarchus labrax]|uniref:uncharacterized protein si:ch73-204p21.2 n=1 Tax=Dicentrarchus labrax TaxID=13489 RepID=UPI0021F61D34|nr:uncharacterized protein si:ch73-204p21.2 [Dicentrarchus labrax]